jgi:hypothetical protein
VYCVLSHDTGSVLGSPERQRPPPLDHPEGPVMPMHLLLGPPLELRAWLKIPEAAENFFFFGSTGL